MISWEMIGAGASALGAMAAGAWRLWGRQWLEERRRRATYDEVLKNSRIFVQMGSLLREWRASSGAQRVLLLYARNSGSPWPVEKPVKVSCLMQSTAEGVENTWKRWQDWEIDPPCREMLGDVLHAMRSERAVRLIAKHMQAGVLRDAFEAQGTSDAVVFGLKWLHRENALVYVSFNFADGDQAAELANSPEQVRRKMVDGRIIWKSK